jgi:cupin 2 domain-containing protein
MTNRPDLPEIAPGPPQKQNVFDAIPVTFQDEIFQTLVESGSVRIERIVSDGHTTPQGEWYDQRWDEWVFLVSGGATLRFADSAEPLDLKPGDHVMIPAGCRHRVERTDSGQKTVWLAVHMGKISAD